MNLVLMQTADLAARRRSVDGTASDDDLASALAAARDGVASTDDLVPAIAEILRTTPSQRVRDAAALTLADLKDARRADVLVEVLRRPDIVTAAGTLIHALDDMGADLPIDVLTSVVLHGSYEARAMALAMLDDGRISGKDPDSDAAARQSFTRLAASEDREGVDAAHAALEGLDVLG